jgi:hypothetical protein
MLAVVLVVRCGAVFVSHSMFSSCMFASGRTAVVLPCKLPAALMLSAPTCRSTSKMSAATSSAAEVFAPAATTAKMSPTSTTKMAAATSSAVPASTVRFHVRAPHHQRADCSESQDVLKHGDTPSIGQNACAGPKTCSVGDSGDREAASNEAL